MDLRTLSARLIVLSLLRRRCTQRFNVSCVLYPGQLPLLDFLMRHPGATQQEAAEHLHVTAASIAQSTKRLEKSGLIEKRTDSANRRRNLLYITETGSQAANDYRIGFDDVDRATFAGFSDEELLQLGRFYDRMIQNVRGDCDLSGLPPLLPLEGGNTTC